MAIQKDPVILGIESSCDDTSAALVRGTRLLSSVIASQKVHELWGGVVPELASRAHQQNIVPVVDAAIVQANIRKEDITAISFTRGPGLMGSLFGGYVFCQEYGVGPGRTAYRSKPHAGAYTGQFLWIRATGRRYHRSLFVPYRQRRAYADSPG